MKIFSKTFGYFELILIFILISIFAYLTLVVSTDIQLHAQFIKDYAYGNKPFQVNFLYYFTVYAVSFFSSKTSALLVVSIYVLAFATLLKYQVVKNIISAEVTAYLPQPAKIASIFSCLLLFCFSLPSILYFTNDYYYLLSFTPNVWHNSTTIFAMPFVIMLFWVSMKQLQEHTSQRLLIIGLLICINAVIKPSFLFVYLIAFPMLLLKQYKFSRLFFINLAPIFIASLLIAAEYYFIYITQDAVNSKVIVHFFYFIDTWAANGDRTYMIGIFFSTLISSFLFPIVAILRNRNMLNDYKVQFALLGTLIAIILANIFTETGTRQNDGNFLWQSYMLSFLLFLVCMLHVLKGSLTNPLKWKAYRFEIAAFLLHVISGLFYFFKIFSTLSYF